MQILSASLSASSKCYVHNIIVFFPLKFLIAYHTSFLVFISSPDVTSSITKNFFYLPINAIPSYNFLFIPIESRSAYLSFAFLRFTISNILLISILTSSLGISFNQHIRFKCSYTVNEFIIMSYCQQNPKYFLNLSIFSLIYYPFTINSL